MRIDSHVHMWNLKDRGEQWTQHAHPVLRRDYLPRHLAPLLHKHGFDGAIVVQGAGTVEENDFLLKQAESEPSIKGVVGWIDLASNNFVSEYERLRKNPNFVGLRPPLHALINNNKMADPWVLQHLKRLERDRFPIDLLISQNDLPLIHKILQDLPDLPAVINHLAWFQVDQQTWDPWYKSIEQIAQNKRVMCKISGMITVGKNTDADSLKPYVHHVIEQFGSGRILFGSDWPVALKAGSYGQVIDTFKKVLPAHLGPQDIDHIRGLNAVEFYQLKE